MGSEDIQGSVFPDDNFKKSRITMGILPVGNTCCVRMHEVELKRIAGPEIEALHKNEVVSSEIKEEV